MRGNARGRQVAVSAPGGGRGRRGHTANQAGFSDFRGRRPVSDRPDREAGGLGRRQLPLVGGDEHLRVPGPCSSDVDRVSCPERCRFEHGDGAGDDHRRQVHDRGVPQVVEQMPFERGFPARRSRTPPDRWPPGRASRRRRCRALRGNASRMPRSQKTSSRPRSPSTVAAKPSPSLTSRGPGRRQDGPRGSSLSIGRISAIGLPCRSTTIRSPRSTASNSFEAWLRKSVAETCCMTLLGGRNVAWSGNGRFCTGAYIVAISKANRRFFLVGTGFRGDTHMGWAAPLGE